MFPSFRYRLLACAMLLGLPQAAPAATIPQDEPGFTATLARAFQVALPGYHVAIRAPLMLEVQSPDGGSHQAPLTTVYDFCQRNPDGCDAAVKSHVAQMSDTFARKEAPPDRALLRAVLRPASYAEAIRKTYAGKEEPPIAPFLGDLWIVCALDMPQAISILKPGDLAKLGLSREEALALATKNDAALFAAIDEAGHPVPGEHISLVATNPYESSRLLLPESWASLAAKNGGQLLVAAPGTDVMIYTDGRQPNALQIMREHVAMVAMRATRPLTTMIFRWTPVGWVVAGQ
ncbi:MAG TPA: DUF1444 family protein [Aliidongia sp.]|nr:DUF1444 family protein [Aliidongia sp.]